MDLPTYSTRGFSSRDLGSSEVSTSFTVPSWPETQGDLLACYSYLADEEMVPRRPPSHRAPLC